jgi:fatty-acyl-CoA synthase
MHPDGYIQLKDRSKDIIISGGENISSIEVEDALYKHPAVQAAAVVAKSRREMGRNAPAPIVELKPGQTATQDEIIAHWCKTLLASFQMPADRRLRRGAEDLDRQDPEIQAAGHGAGSVNGR